jgi:hypothetical protein
MRHPIEVPPVGLLWIGKTAANGAFRPDFENACKGTPAGFDARMLAADRKLNKICD